MRGRCLDIFCAAVAACYFVFVDANALDVKKEKNRASYLDDIRIERETDIESALSSQIDNLKKKLTLHRKRKTELQTKRDIAATIEERIESYNDKGRRIYGPAWDEGAGDSESFPIKELVSLPEHEIRALRIEAQNIITERKAAEEKDLWHLWNDDKAQQVKPTATSSRSARQDEATEVLTARAKRQAKPPPPDAKYDPRFAPPPVIESKGGMHHQQVSFPPRGILPPPRPNMRPPPPMAENKEDSYEIEPLLPSPLPQRPRGGPRPLGRPLPPPGPPPRTVPSYKRE